MDQHGGAEMAGTGASVQFAPLPWFPADQAVAATCTAGPRALRCLEAFCDQLGTVTRRMAFSFQALLRHPDGPFLVLCAKRLRVSSEYDVLQLQRQSGDARLFSLLQGLAAAALDPGNEAGTNGGFRKGELLPPKLPRRAPLLDPEWADEDDMLLPLPACVLCVSTQPGCRRKKRW